jgi:hypothetical protein
MQGRPSVAINVLGRAVEAAEEAAVGDATKLRLAASVRLRLVQAVLEEEAEDAPGDDEQCAQRERARRVAYLWGTRAVVSTCMQGSASEPGA